MRSLRSSVAASSARSLNIEERADSGVEGPDALDKLLIRHMIRLVDVDVQVLGEDRRDNPEVGVGLGLSDFPDRRRPIRLPIGEYVLQKSLAQLVARAFRPTTTAIAGYESAGLVVLLGSALVRHCQPAAATTSVKVGSCETSPSLSVTLTERFAKLPAAVGVPETAPEDVLTLIPAGHVPTRA